MNLARTRQQVGRRGSEQEPHAGICHAKADDATGDGDD